MAGPIVHEKFFSDCLKECDINIDSTNNNCNIYSQGHDLLLYIETYNFINNRQISLLLSNYKIQQYVYNYLDIALKNDSVYEDENVKLFLYGYIAHHILDSYFHPYITQYCEDYLPVSNKEWVHGCIETLCDADFIKKYYGYEPSKYKLYKDFKYNKVENEKFILNIESSAVQTYNLKGLGKKIDKALNTIDKYMYLYRYDPNNVKKTLGKMLDKIIDLGAEDFFYSENNLYKLDQYRNLENKEWINYWSKDTDNIQKSTDGLNEIYINALKMTKQIINDIELAIKNSKIDFEDIKDIIPNKSAITGIECGKDLAFVKKKKGIWYE